MHIAAKNSAHDVFDAVDNRDKDIRRDEPQDDLGERVGPR